MMGIGFPELMIILVIIMIIFGAGKLPEIGAAFGNSIKNFKKSMKEAEESDEEPKLEENSTPRLESGETAEAVPESSEEAEKKEVPANSEKTE
jgi:sec-independent protein translocase protein TatA